MRIQVTCRLSSLTPLSYFSHYVNFCYSIRLLGSAYLVSPCSSAPFRWGRRSCLGLRTGVSPHFSMNSMREILALRGGYERGRIPLPSPMPPESGAPPHNTHPSMVPLSLSVTVATLVHSSLFLLSHYLLRSFYHGHTVSNRSPSFFIPYRSFFVNLTDTDTPLYTTRILCKITKHTEITCDE